MSPARTALRPPALRSPGLQRWLRMAVAVLALLGGEGFHELLHVQEWSARAAAHAPSGQLEAHAGDCQHRRDVHETHHACVHCRGGHVHDQLPLCLTTVSAAADTCRRIESRACRRGASIDHPGTLGARGPPLTTV